MNLLAVGDVFGNAGRKAIIEWLPQLRDELGVSFCVVNVENMAQGKGADPAGVRDVLDAGADALTSGNHIWAHKTHRELLERERRLVRPANYPPPCPGRGYTIVESLDGLRVAVINLIGRVFMTPVDDPFRAADHLIEELKDRADVIVVDFHAEATSEKLALSYYLDGRVAAVFGTHTHIQTADARVLPGGTGCITDLGMTGPYDSIIGMAKEPTMERFVSGRPVPMTPAEREVGLRGALFEIDDRTKRCRHVTRIARGAGGQ